MAKLVVDQRQNGALNPLAAFYGKPTTAEEVLASKMIADPLRMLEIVMPVAGGGAVVVASCEVAERCRHRPVRITGFGEHLTIKTPTYAKDMCDTLWARRQDKRSRWQGWSLAISTRQRYTTATPLPC